MSYCRFGWDGSNVYVYETTDGKIECCCCALCLSPRPENLLGVECFIADSPAEMIAHLEKHREARHNVPQYAIAELRRASRFLQTKPEKTECVKR